MNRAATTTPPLPTATEVQEDKALAGIAANLTALTASAQASKAAGGDPSALLAQAAPMAIKVAAAVDAKVPDARKDAMLNGAAATTPEEQAWKAGADVIMEQIHTVLLKMINNMIARHTAAGAGAQQPQVAGVTRPAAQAQPLPAGTQVLRDGIRMEPA